MKLNNKPEDRIGNRPGILQEQASDARIQWARYSSTSLEQGDVNHFDELPAVTEGSCIWLDITGVPGKDGLTRLQERYELHRLALEDVQNQGQIPKYEEFEQHLYAVLQIPQGDLEGEGFAQLNFFLAPGLIISIHPNEDLFDPVRQRLQSNRGVIRSAGEAYLLYALVDLAVDLGFPRADFYNTALLDLEDRAADGRQDLSHDIYALRRPLSLTMRQAQRQRNVVASLLERDRKECDSACSVYWRDCLDHAERYLEAISHLRDSAGDLLSTHLALVSHRMNDVMKVLTVMSSVFIPLSFVVGLYGMNFNTESQFNMPELSWRYGYFYVWGVMLLIVSGLLIFFRRKRWI